MDLVLAAFELRRDFLIDSVRRMSWNKLGSEFAQPISSYTERILGLKVAKK